MELIFLRHGQTDWNITQRLQGQTDVPLNETGIREAESARPILAGITFDAVFCSPLTRAKHTLQLAYPCENVRYDDRLAEWNFGPYEGQVLPESFFASLWIAGREPVEGVERLEDLLIRVSSFYRDAEQEFPVGRILVVSHGGVSGAMHAAVYGMAPEENLRPYCLPNAVPVLFRKGEPPVYLKEN